MCSCPGQLYLQISIFFYSILAFSVHKTCFESILYKIAGQNYIRVKSNYVSSIENTNISWLDDSRSLLNKHNCAAVNTFQTNQAYMQLVMKSKVWTSPVWTQGINTEYSSCKAKPYQQNLTILSGLCIYTKLLSTTRAQLVSL